MWLIHPFGSLLNLGICKEYPIMARAKSPRNGNTRTTNAATATAVTNPVAKQNGSQTDLEAEIRRRAYELYAQRGYTPGHENEDWFVAEREILARTNQQQSA
jgi:Protein of unknown function (DUF2934)